jgi:hypothetical protein
MTRSLAFLAVLPLGCARPECTPPDYRNPECRVLAENALAQLTQSDGVEVRFQSPSTTGTGSWDAKGLVSLSPEGTLTARVAGLGGFRISVHRPDDGPEATPLIVTNVHPDIPPLPGEVSRTGLSRRLELDLTETVTEIRGELPADLCAGPYRIAALADIQTNPLQFAQLVEDLHREANEGEPLLGVLLLGDVAEFGTREEMDHVAEIMATSPVPFAVTAGNHDVYADYDAVYNDTFGPGNHAFDVCDTHVVLVDTGNGFLAPSVQGRLDVLMKTDQPVSIAGMHHPPYPGRTSSGWTREDHAQHLVAEFSARGGDLLLAGHLHQRLASPNTPVPQIIVGTGGATQYAVDPDYGYLRLRVDAGQLSTCFVSVPAPGSPGTTAPKRGPDTCN